MPLHGTTEGRCCFLNCRDLKGGVENERFDIFHHTQRAMNVRFNVVIEPRVET